MYQYAIDNNGNLPGCIDGTRRGICTGGTDCVGFDSGTHTDVTVSDTESCNLDVLTGAYVVNLPVDPSGVPTGATAYTGYDIESTSGRVTVYAPIDENASISVTR